MQFVTNKEKKIARQLNVKSRKVEGEEVWVGYVLAYLSIASCWLAVDILIG